jgi:hypothetical protein
MVFKILHVSGLNNSTPSTAAAFGATLSFVQFMLAIDELANRIYSNYIEKFAGCELQYLPPKLRETASLTAKKLLLKNKIIPIAIKLGMKVIATVMMRTLISVLNRFIPVVITGG